MAERRWSFWFGISLEPGIWVLELYESRCFPGSRRDPHRGKGLSERPGSSCPSSRRGGGLETIAGCRLQAVHRLESVRRGPRLLHDGRRGTGESTFGRTTRKERRAPRKDLHRARSAGAAESRTQTVATIPLRRAG